MRQTFVSGDGRRWRRRRRRRSGAHRHVPHPANKARLMTRINKRTLTAAPDSLSVTPRGRGGSCLKHHIPGRLYSYTHATEPDDDDDDDDRRLFIQFARTQTTTPPPPVSHTHTHTSIYAPFVFLSYTLRPLGRFFSPPPSSVRHLRSLKSPARENFLSIPFSSRCHLSLPPNSAGVAASPCFDPANGS